MACARPRHPCGRPGGRELRFLIAEKGPRLHRPEGPRVLSRRASAPWRQARVRPPACLGTSCFEAAASSFGASRGGLPRASLGSRAASPPDAASARQAWLTIEKKILHRLPPLLRRGRRSRTGGSAEGFRGVRLCEAAKEGFRRVRGEFWRVRAKQRRRAAEDFCAQPREFFRPVRLITN